MLDLLEAGISVITAVNIQHIESLNDVVARTTGVRVRETVPDYVLQRADEVVNVDVSVETLRTRLRQGKIYGVEKIEQALSNFFRKGNLSALRELALRQVARTRRPRRRTTASARGSSRPVIPEKVMVAMASRGSAKRLLRIGSRIAGRLASDWFAVYVETPGEEPGRIKPADHVALLENIRFAEELGAKVVQLKARRSPTRSPSSRGARGSRTSSSASRRARAGTSSCTARSINRFLTRSATRRCTSCRSGVDDRTDAEWSQRTMVMTPPRQAC